MKTKRQEAHLAFELWETLTRLESLLWARYYNVLINRIMDQENDESIAKNTQDPEDFPF